MPVFHTGEIVIANTKAQGLVLGAEYRIVDVESRSTPFGAFTTYIVTAVRTDLHGSATLRVGNGHLLFADVNSIAGQVLRRKAQEEGR